MSVQRRWLGVVVACAMVAVIGCGDDESGANSAGSPPAEVKAESNVISGKITMGDGSALRGDIKDIAISIGGVSEAAEKVSYSPAVKPDGTYRQKVAGGQYYFNRGTITVNYGNAVFNLPLEPVGMNWNKNQDAADGIVQNFVWKPSGATPYGKDNGQDIGNATHWYGMSIGIRAEGYRNDIKSVPKTIPDGSKIKFTLTPTGKAIDGTEPKDPVVFDRVHDNSSYKPMDLNDILPAPYDLSGTVTFPDGSTHPLLLRSQNPDYIPTLKIAVEKDNIIGGIWKQPVTYVID